VGDAENAVLKCRAESSELFTKCADSTAKMNETCGL